MELFITLAALAILGYAAYRVLFGDDGDLNGGSTAGASLGAKPPHAH